MARYDRQRIIIVSNKYEKADKRKRVWKVIGLGGIFLSILEAMFLVILIF